MSIVKKNLKATKGKKRWRRNIDVTNLLDEVESIKQQEKLQKEVQEKMKNKSLYFIDEKPDAKIKERQALDPNRFKKKERELTESELKIVGRLTHKMMKKDEKKNKRMEAKAPVQDDEEDPWGEEPSTKKTSQTSTGAKAPVVLPPHEGQSYNPTYKAHKDLLQKVVEEEVIKEKAKEAVEYLDREKPEQVVKNKVKTHSLKERLEAREKAERKFKKQQDHDFLYLKKICREMDKNEEEHKKKLEEEAKQDAEEKKLIAEGKLIKGPKLNRNKYEFQGSDFQLAGDLASNLRSIKVTGSIARDQFDSIYRRGLIEKTSYGKKKKKKSKIPKVKYHNTDRNRKNDDDDSLAIHK